MGKCGSGHDISRVLVLKSTEGLSYAPGTSEFSSRVQTLPRAFAIRQFADLVEDAKVGWNPAEVVEWSNKLVYDTYQCNINVQN